MNKNLWFKRKSYGWGWTPVTWQGWLVLAVWLVVFYFTINTFGHEWLKNVVISVISVGVLLGICYLKGEKPKWQWGGKDIKIKK